MLNEQWTESGKAVTSLILDIFRLNGRLIIAGDRLVSELGLTSARWQILGSIANSQHAQSVAWHARSMGVHRQGIQRIVNELISEGIVEFHPNPRHKRAHLIAMSQKGHKLFKAAIELQTPWINALSDGLKPQDIEIAKDVIEKLKIRLEKEIET
ncbi:MarR family winged helix-turn-helix transcriptional regulator [Kordiimonas aquimaris]|uniref:MarR family winged helix-turn-helix transcriptional regulator n=1 Tax=Kordiimonas aquimaris TaxID=707591 RepID=UPI0021CE0011|nr:MarR family transcriptional regulator [Kordiimonas aquimaris]